MHRASAVVFLVTLACCARTPTRALTSTRTRTPAPALTPAPAPTRTPALTRTPTLTPSTASPSASAPAPPPAPITLAAVGDIMLARTIGIRYERDPSRSPFAAVATILRDADVAVGNLECVLGTGGTPMKKAFTFRAPPAAIATLTEAGLDFVSLANNHIMDFGPDLLGGTASLLDKANILHAGAGMSEADAHRAAVLDVKGIRLAFLGYVHVPTEGVGGFDTKSWDAKGDGAGVAWADTARIASDVATAKANADVVVVMLHAGYELSMNANVIQKQLAHAAIDAGASLVIGAHPHVLQGTEHYKRGFIAYSLGNFVFDGRDEYSAILRATIDRDGVRDVDWTPVVLRGGFPQPTDAATSRWIVGVIRQLSLQVGR